MSEFLALSESGEYRTISAPTRQAAEKLIRWNEPSEKWVMVTPKNTEPKIRRAYPVYPDVSEHVYAHYKTLANRLSRCLMYPGSFDKRFCRDMAAKLNKGEPISANQMNWLDEMQWKYRAQLKAQVSP